MPKDASHRDLSDATLRPDPALGVRRRHAPKMSLKKKIRALVAGRRRREGGRAPGVGERRLRRQRRATRPHARRLRARGRAERRFFFPKSRSTPTANADDPRRSEGTQRCISPRDLPGEWRGIRHRPLGVGPSARAEKSPKIDRRSDRMAGRATRSPWARWSTSGRDHAVGDSLRPIQLWPI